MVMDFEKEFEVLLELCNPALIAAGGLGQLETQLTKMMTEIKRLQQIEDAGQGEYYTEVRDGKKYMLRRTE